MNEEAEGGVGGVQPTGNLQRLNGFHPEIGLELNLAFCENKRVETSSPPSESMQQEMHFKNMVPVISIFAALFGERHRFSELLFLRLHGVSHPDRPSLSSPDRRGFPIGDPLTRPGTEGLRTFSAASEGRAMA